MDEAIITAWNGRIGNARVYLYDARTGEALVQCKLAWLGTGANAEYKGVQYTNTTLSVDVVDIETRNRWTLTAEDFPGRSVVVKVWTPSGSDVRALVDQSRGWTHCNGLAPREELPAALLGNIR